MRFAGLTCDGLTDRSISTYRREPPPFLGDAEDTNPATEFKGLRKKRVTSLGYGDE